jgi:ABC-type dipeptide/oligopeptide/nickel transport system permease subunit
VRSTRAAAVVFAALVAFCLIWPAVSPHGADHVDLSKSRQGPSLGHPLGTDQFGRDMVARLAEGGRTTLAIAALALGLILLIGGLYGTVAAVAGGKVDAVMMRAVDGLLAIPRLPVAIVILVSLRFRAQTVPAVAFALAILGWMLTARLVRGQVLALMSRDFVRAARAVGASWPRVARRHLVPSSAQILLVALLLELPTVVLGEALLSVIGLGPEPPTATWGNIAQEGLLFSRLWVMLLTGPAAPPDPSGHGRSGHVRRPPPSRVVAPSRRPRLMTIPASGARVCAGTVPIL